MEKQKMNPLGVAEVLSGLIYFDLSLVEKGYYITFPESSKFRFRNCHYGRSKFSTLELNRLSKFFVFNGEKWVLDPSDEFMDFLGMANPL